MCVCDCRLTRLRPTDPRPTDGPTVGLVMPHPGAPEVPVVPHMGMSEESVMPHLGPRGYCARATVSPTSLQTTTRHQHKPGPECTRHNHSLRVPAAGVQAPRHNYTIILPQPAPHHHDHRRHHPHNQQANPYQPPPPPPPAHIASMAKGTAF